MSHCTVTTLPLPPTSLSVTAATASILCLSAAHCYTRLTVQHSSPCHPGVAVPASLPGLTLATPSYSPIVPHSPTQSHTVPHSPTQSHQPARPQDGRGAQRGARQRAGHIRRAAEAGPHPGGGGLGLGLARTLHCPQEHQTCSRCRLGQFLVGSTELWSGVWSIYFYWGACDRQEVIQLF